MLLVMLLNDLGNPIFNPHKCRQQNLSVSMMLSIRTQTDMLPEF